NGTQTAGTYFELNGSGDNGALLDTHPTTGLVNGRTDPLLEYGRYVYTINPGAGPGGGGGGGGQDDPGQSSVPVLRGMKPRRGSTLGGTVVTLVGANFQGVTEILFGTTSVRTFQVYAGRRIVVTAPPNAPGPAFVRVRTASGLSDLTPLGRFLYEGGSAPGGGGGGGDGQGQPAFVKVISGLEEAVAFGMGQGLCSPWPGLGQDGLISPLRWASSAYLDPLPPPEKAAACLPLRKTASGAGTAPVLDWYFADLLKEDRDLTV